MIAKFDNFKEMVKPNMWLCNPWARYETVATPLPFPYGEFEGKNLLDRMFGRRESSSAALTGKIGVDYINGSGVFTHAENGSWGTYYRTTDYIPAVAGEYTLTYQNNWDRANGYALALVRYKLVDGVYIPQIPSDPRESATLNTSGVLNANAAVIDAGYETSVSITCEDGDYLTCSVVVATSQLLSDTRFPHILTLESTPATIPGPAYDPAVYQSYLAAVVAPRVIEQNRLLGVICALPNTKNTGLTFQFNTMSQLDFTYEKDGSDSYKLLANRRYICVDGVGFFAITSCKRSSSSDGYTVKSVTAVSCEKELENRQIPFIPDGTYTLKELLTGKTFNGSTDEDTVRYDGLLSNLGFWSFAVDQNQEIIIPADIAALSRTFEDVDTSGNMMSFLMNDAQDAFGCVFDCDYNTRTIYIVSRADYLQSSGIQLTQHDFIRTIDLDELSDSLYTAVHVVGNDDMVIAPVNPLGTNVIYNFDHFISWMSPALHARLAEWNSAVATQLSGDTGTYRNWSLLYYTELEINSNLKLERDRLAEVQKIYTTCQSNIAAAFNDADAVTQAQNSSQTLEKYDEAALTEDDVQGLVEEVKARLVTVASEITTNATEISASNGRLTTYKNEMDSISRSLSLNIYFDNTLYAELEPYIVEAAYDDEYTVITDDMPYYLQHDEHWNGEGDKYHQMLELYDRTQKQLLRVSRPTQTISVSLDAFAFDVTAQSRLVGLQVGRSVAIELSDGQVVDLFLTELALDYDDKNMSFKFGNKVERADTQSIFDDTFGKIQKTANTVQYVKDEVYPLKAGVLSRIQKFIEESRNLTADAALSSLNQEVIIDDSGYTGRQLLPNQTDQYENEWLKITNNRIVFLQDQDGQTQCRTALGKVLKPGTVNEWVYGINAEYVVGKLITGETLSLGVVINDVATDINDAFAGIGTKLQWLQFTPEGGLTIGADDEAILTNIKNARYSFCLNGEEIAWIDGNNGALYMSELHASKRISLGSKDDGGYFDFISTTSGMALKWRVQTDQDQDAARAISGEIALVLSGSTLGVDLSEVNPSGISANDVEFAWYRNGVLLTGLSGATRNLDSSLDNGARVSAVVSGKLSSNYYGVIDSAAVHTYIAIYSGGRWSLSEVNGGVV